MAAKDVALFSNITKMRLANTPDLVAYTGDGDGNGNTVLWKASKQFSFFLESEVPDGLCFYVWYYQFD